jgi:hypothetical protein
MKYNLRGKDYELDVIDTLVLPMLTTFGLDVSGTLEATPAGVNQVLNRLSEPSAQRNIAYTMQNTIIGLEPSIAYYANDGDWKLRASVSEITEFLTAILESLASKTEEKPKRKSRQGRAAAV